MKAAHYFRKSQFSVLLNNQAMQLLTQTLSSAPEKGFLSAAEATQVLSDV